MSEWRERLDGLGVALGFFLRLPLPRRLRPPPERAARLDRAAIWFPVAGIVVAIPSAILYLLAAPAFSGPLAAGLAIGLAMLLTGALHEDGLADCADGLGGGTDPESTLRIMRDSRIGVFGASALVFSIGLRWAALAALAPGAGAAALLVAHAAGRAGITTALAFSTYARPSGTAEIVAHGLSRAEWGYTLLLSLLLAALVGGFSAVFAAMVGMALAALFLMRFEWRGGGYTGDALGAMEQITEISVLVVLAAMWNAP